MKAVANLTETKESRDSGIMAYKFIRKRGNISGLQGKKTS